MHGPLLHRPRAIDLAAYFGRGRARFVCTAPYVETILLIVLILMLIGAIPTWPHSKNWWRIGFDRDHSHRAAVDGTVVTELSPTAARMTSRAIAVSCSVRVSATSTT